MGAEDAAPPGPKNIEISSHGMLALFYIKPIYSRHKHIKSYALSTSLV
jgi:hypothetical protein